MTETRLRQARIACALEGYRRSHEEYPESLDSLIPVYLAGRLLDVCNQEPFHYRRVAPTQFMLWSVGANQIDDGGRAPKHPPDSDGDWVWKTAN